MICSNCGRDNPDDVAYCLDCGRKLEREVQGSGGVSPGKVACPRCGVENPSTMNFCKHCGAPLTSRDVGGSAPRAGVGTSPAPVAVSPGPAAPGAIAAPEAVSPSPVVPAGGAGPAIESRSAPSSPRICSRCHSTLDADAQFCKYCGAPLSSSEPSHGEGGLRSRTAEPQRFDNGPVSGQTGPLGSAGPVVNPTGARLIAILKDGSEGQSYPLAGEVTEIGRSEGAIVLADDPYLSPRHARIVNQNGRFFLKDLASTNGIFIRLRESTRIQHGATILIGQQVLRFEVLEEAERGLGPASQHGTLIFGTPEGTCIARLCQLTTEGIVRDVYHIRRQEVVIGREGPDIVFPDDPFMSRRHAKITYDGTNRTFVLEDLDSFNGTSLRFRGERELRPGDQFRVGNHLFLFETGGVER